MKKLILFLCISMICLVSKAQTSMMATLCHNGEITTYFTNSALSEAYNAAQEGDVITLSSGNFNAIAIGKPITLRGAGMMGNNPTEIQGSLYIEVTTPGKPVIIEGIHFISAVNLDKGSANLTKCRIRNLNQASDTQSKLFHCDIYGSFSPYGNNATSYLFGCHVKGEKLYNAYYENCTCEFKNLSGTPSLKNSIIKTSTNSLTKFNQGASVSNCVYVGPISDPFSDLPPFHNNINLPSNTDFFKEDSTIYELKDEYAKTWLGSDGTQVGMHGSSLPFDPTTSVPQIKKYEVSAKTSVDGKLSVNIEIDGE